MIKTGFQEKLLGSRHLCNGQIDTIWPQSIAVGDRYFVEKVKYKLGYKAFGRKVPGSGDDFELKESASPYKANFVDEMNALRSWNELKFRIYAMYSI